MKSDWLGRFRRERRVLARVRRAAWRLEQAKKEHRWAIWAARGEKVSVRKVAEAAGLSPTRIDQIAKDADADAMDLALGQLRTAGWPAPEDPDGSDDEELAGRETVAERLVDEAGWVLRCADWLDHLERESFPPVANLRPEGDFPDRSQVVVRPPRIAAILRRIAFDVEELARARRIDDLQAAAVGDDPRAERRRRLAEPDLTFAEFCDRTGTPWRSTLQGDRAWEHYQTELFRRGERDKPYSPYRQQRRPAPPDGRTEN